MNYFNASDMYQSSDIYLSDSDSTASDNFINIIRRLFQNNPPGDYILSEWSKNGLTTHVKKPAVDTTSTGLSRYEILRNNTQES
jgi:hypothetical protein